METWQATDSVVIRAPAQRIYETLRDYNAFGERFGVGRLRRGYSTRIVGPERLAEEGSVVEHRIFSPVGTLRFRRRIEALEAGRRIAERYIGPDYEGTGTWELEELPEWVRVSFAVDARDAGWRSRLLYHLVGPILHHHVYWHGLERLRHRLEAESGTAVAAAQEGKPWQAVESMVIRAPAERIYETLRDYNNFGRLFGNGGMRRGYETRILGPEPLAEQGSLVWHRALTPIGYLSFIRRIEALDPNRRIAERYLGPNFEGTGTWELEELTDGVRVSFLYDAADTSWRPRLIYRVMGTVGTNNFYWRGLQRVKRRLESEA